MFYGFPILSAMFLLDEGISEPITATILSMEVSGNKLNISFLLRNNTIESTKAIVKYKLFEGEKERFFLMDSIYVKWKDSVIVQKSFDLSNFESQKGVLELNARHASPQFNPNGFVLIKEFDIKSNDFSNFLLSLRQMVFLPISDFFNFVGKTLGVF